MERTQESPWLELADGLMRPGGEALTAWLAARLPAPPLAVLDVGCGVGDSTAWLEAQGYQATGLDISRHLIEIGHSKHPSADLVAADAAAMPFAEGQFQALLCECTLSILPEAAWRECARVLAAGGRLLISDVYARRERGQQSPLTEAGWRQELAHCGLAVQEWADQSQALDDFIAQTLWDRGSLDGLCGCGDQQELKRCGVGYFTAVAEKEHK